MSLKSDKYFLRKAFAEAEQAEILRAFRKVLGFREIADFARRSGLSREHFYRAFKDGADPRISTVMKVLDTMQLRLDITVKKRSKKAVEAVAPEAKQEQEN
jgi:probable addiction module antidote protein